MQIIKPTIYAILGASRSGKNTVYGFLDDMSPWAMEEVKFSAPMKRSVEEAYGLVPGAMEYAEFRNAEVPGRPGYTFLQLMVDAYHNCDWVCDNIWIPSLLRQAESNLELGIDVAFTDIRKLTEADHVIELARTTGANLVTIIVNRDTATPQTSDNLLPEITQKLSDEGLLTRRLDNNGTLAQLRYQIETMLGLYYVFRN